MNAIEKYEALREFTEKVLSACIEDPDGGWVQACVDEFRDRFPAVENPAMFGPVKSRGITATELMLSRELGPSLRDLLAVHAPPEPLWNFEVPMDRPRPEHPRGAGWVDLEPEERRAASAEYHDESNRWHADRNNRARCMWPWVWADAVLAARNPLPSAEQCVAPDFEMGEGI